MIERYTRPEMGKIWTPENRYQAWLRVEIALSSIAPTKSRKPPVTTSSPS